MASYISSAIHPITSAVDRWSGISDFKAAAVNFMNHQWKAGAVNALTGAAKTAVIFGAIYVGLKVREDMEYAAEVDRFWNTPKQCGDHLLGRGQALQSCEGFISKGFMSHGKTIPPLNRSTDFFVRMADCTCQAVLTRCGMKKYPIGAAKVWFETPDSVRGMLSDGNWAEAGGGIANMFQQIDCNGNA